MMKHSFSINYQDIKLISLDENGIEKLRTWRNDKEATKYLRDIPYITEEIQKKWYLHYLNDDNIYSFSIVEANKLNRIVGSLSIYDFDFKNGICEIGKIQIGDKDAHGKHIASKAMAALAYFAFRHFNLKKVIATVNENNIAAIKSYNRIGFKKCGSHKSPARAGGDEIEIELTLEVLLLNCPDLNSVLL